MQELRNKSKYTGIKRIIFSAKYAIEGLIYAYKNEKSLLVHAICTITAIILGLIFKLSPGEWSTILITLSVILSVELLNTAIEAVVDMVTLEYNPLAKIAKDCGGGATFVVSMTGVIIAIVIFGPKVLALLGI